MSQVKINSYSTKLNSLTEDMAKSSKGIKKSFNKVFEVGSPKTGTTSLGEAYRILGLKAKGFDAEMQELRKTDMDAVLHYADQFEAFQDGPWHNIDVSLLDKTFPNSRYILLERDDESWYESMEYQYKIRTQRDFFLSRPRSWHIKN